MRIGIDARELTGRTTGVGRYLGGLLREWAVDARSRAHEFVLYAPQAINQLPQRYENLPASLLTANLNSPEARAAGFTEPFPGSGSWHTIAPASDAIRAVPSFD